MKTTSRRSPAARTKKSAPTARAKTVPVRTPDHERALQDYEEALKSFGRKDYTKAVAQFEAVIKAYPSEREVADRCRIYQSVARVRGSAGGPRPKDAEGHYLHGIVALNEGRLDEAADEFEKAIKMDPQLDKAWYAAAVVCSRKGDRAGLLANLGRAVGIDHRANRIAALNDAEFETLRVDPDFLSVIGRPPGADA